MRVIAGKYKGRKLVSLKGEQTRPTSDKIKGALFNMIGPYFDGGTVLDLYSGSGNLAIEAVSRGCETAFCVDNHYPAVNVIRENITLTKESGKFHIMKCHADQALQKLAAKRQQFDLVFLDPPYAKQTIVPQIQFMQTHQLLTDGALIVCETDKVVALPDELPGLRLKKRQRYGITEIVIYDQGE
ncbi:16S rRNA (guanine(966)-N(2))-methyltransferase RsmD [Vagococcus acidifermentans]|uniref:16S rRNA (Guanine(966)-N(2))-methyltransferase RsmD n=1 Tax=Vagococcus acidifermentans TaxID=564710 RepID=A0A430B090_9ENTE|nr:16S rRNA (guanine(966)-N(2))-methyltransferase RsmD [Vagococcus acidifermentans]RSU13745.1 16S rRNA (guanine(966)-N(2))-methyltransferase RsmD [Vagococcus acidifermentans]